MRCISSHVNAENKHSKCNNVIVALLDNHSLLGLFFQVLNKTLPCVDFMDVIMGDIP